VKGFKVCCMSSAVAGTNGDILWNGSEGTGVLGECEKDVGSDTAWWR